MRTLYFRPVYGRPIVEVFADDNDMKVYVKRVPGSIDLIKLQSALDLLNDWASK